MDLGRRRTRGVLKQLRRNIPRKEGLTGEVAMTQRGEVVGQGRLVDILALDLLGRDAFDRPKADTTLRLADREPSDLEAGLGAHDGTGT